MIKISIDQEKCTGCGECLKTCPKGPRIYEIKEIQGRKTASILDPSYCLGCTQCLTACKPKAITLERI